MPNVVMCVRRNGRVEEETLTEQEAASMLGPFTTPYHFFLQRREAKNWDEFVKSFKYKPFTHVEHVYDIDYDWHFLVVDMIVPDINNPSKTIRISQKTKVPPFGTHGINEEGALAWLRDILQAMECHEVDEWFNYDGERTFDPHKE